MGAGSSVFVEVEPDERDAILYAVDTDRAPVELVDERAAIFEEIDERAI